MPRTSLNILFSSAGRRVELLRSFRRAYDELRLEGRIVAVDADPLAPALHVADRSYLVPRVDSPDYVPHLVSICQREEVDVMFPLIDLDIQVLAPRRSELEARGTRLGLCWNSDLVRAAADKWQTVAVFRSLGLAAPASWLPDDVPADVQYPLFIKPRFGSASQNTFKLKDRRELEFFAHYVPRPIVQEFIAGREITTDVTCDLSGRVLSVVLRERLEVRGGEVSKGVTVQNPEIVRDCVQICKALDTVGPACVQCIVRNNVPHYTEVNTRFGGGFPLGMAAGANSPRLLLASIANIPIEMPPVDAYKTGVYMSRFDESLFLSEQQRAEISRYRV